MKLKELMENASKGDFEVRNDNEIWARRDYGWFLICKLEARPIDKANAQLIAHTLNTYMELVEALEEIRENHSVPHRQRRGKHRSTTSICNQALERANNVSTGGED